MLASWELLILLSRVGLYLGVAGTLGACFALLVFYHGGARGRLLNYLRLSSVLGALAVAVSFIARSAAMSGSFATAIDELFLTILWQSGIGTGSRWQWASFGILLLGSAGLGYRRLLWPASALMACGAITLLWSFTFSGHFATQPWFNKLALSLHVLAMSLWLGSFYPLLTTLKEAEAESNLKRFSSWGVAIVVVLMGCGVWMGVVLLEDVTHLLSMPYGWVLLSKFGLVMVLLSLAAANKWILVPRYDRQPTGIHRSIQGEIMVGLFILLTTAILANLVSPYHLTGC